MERYVVIDTAGTAINIVLWDGWTEWEPPEGCTAELEDSDEGRAALAKADEAAAAAASAAADDIEE